MQNIKTKFFFISLFSLAFIFIFSITTFAHSGRTDSQGGHHDYINGGYHFHHGYPAHDHPNGECPYSNVKNNGYNNENNISDVENSKPGFWKIIGSIIAAVFSDYFLAYIPATLLTLLLFMLYCGKNKDDIVYRIYEISIIIFTIIISIFLIIVFLR